MICPNCNKKTASIKSQILKGKLLDGCDDCLPQQYQQGSGTTAQYYRRQMQTKHRQNLAQPVDPREFIKAFPDKAREMYSDETYRKYST